jgi:hypothetical protein
MAKQIRVGVLPAWLVDLETKNLRLYSGRNDDVIEIEAVGGDLGSIGGYLERRVQDGQHPSEGGVAQSELSAS